MKKMLFSNICCLVILLFLNPRISFSALTLSTDGMAVFDSNSGLYWLSDLTYFFNKSATVQLTEIANLPGSWRMAVDLDMESLDLNSDADISSVFIPQGTSTGSLTGEGSVRNVYG